VKRLAQQLIIVADDLTGAADSAARGHAAGLSAEIWLQPPLFPANADLVALTSDSRHLPADIAAQQVRATVAAMPMPHAPVWYKKIDSTLRGHLGAEISAMLAALTKEHAVIAPAFPAQHRGLRAGMLVAEQAAAGLHLPTMLAGYGPVAAFGLAAVRQGSDRLAHALRQAAAQARLLVFDALTDADLAIVAAAAERALPNALLCGSAGLAAILAARLAPAADHPDERAAAVRGPLLIVVGSASTRAHEQIAFLRSSGQYAAYQIGDTIEPGGRDLLLHLPELGPQAALDSAASRRVSEALAEQAHTIVQRERPGLLVLVGGDTAIAVLARLGIDSLRVMRELLPGVPLAYGRDRTGSLYTLALKAGSHGDAAALGTIVQRAQEPAL
jgi:uncharacterized protein YgbK (DUF1537 family)